MLNSKDVTSSQLLTFIFNRSEDFFVVTVNEMSETSIRQGCSSFNNESCTVQEDTGRFFSRIERGIKGASTQQVKNNFRLSRNTCPGGHEIFKVVMKLVSIAFCVDHIQY